MKSLLVGLAVSAASLVGASAASAQTGYVYLGGALNLPHCQQIAGLAGYQLATFGGFVNGIWVWNGCFGSNLGGGAGGQKKYDVYSRYDLDSCAEDIEWELGEGVRCRAQGSFIRCISSRGGIKAELETVACVDRAYPLQ